MEVKEAIKNRHSIREFEPKLVSKKTIKNLIKYASIAPSAENRQPWIFYIVSTNNARDKIIKILNNFLIENKKEVDNLEPKLQNVIKNFYSNLGGAKNIIFIYRNSKIEENRFSDIASISCAVENLMIYATSEKLGTCWIGSLRDKTNEISKLLNIPKNQELIASILIGYPKKGAKILMRKKKKLNEILKFV